MKKANPFVSGLSIMSMETNNNVDSETSELMSSDTVKKWRLNVKPDTFIFVYGRLLSVLGDIGEVDAKVFLMMADNVDIGTCDVRMSQAIYDKIAKVLNFKEGTVRNAIVSLQKKHLLIKHPKIRGHYRVNPEFAWKGKQEGRPVELRKLLLEIKEESEDGS